MASTKRSSLELLEEEKKKVQIEMEQASKQKEIALKQIEQSQHNIQTLQKDLQKAQQTQKKASDQIDLTYQTLANEIDKLAIQPISDTTCPNKSVLSEAKCPKKTVPSVLLEKQSNISCFQLYIPFHEIDKTLDLITKNSISVVLVSSLPSKTIQLAIQLNGGEEKLWNMDLPLMVKQASIAIQADYIHLRLPFGNSNASASALSCSNSSRLDYSVELEPENYECIRCRFCALDMLAQDCSTFRIFPLPSENWADMVDFWGVQVSANIDSGCGGLEHLSMEPIKAHENRIYIGEAYLLIHENSINENSVLIDTADEKSLDNDITRNINCRRCHTWLGTADSKHTYTFYKHVMTANSKQNQSSEEDTFKKYFVDGYVGTKVLEIAESRNIYHYYLASQSESNASSNSSESLFIHIQLLSWDSSLYIEGISEETRVLKILYEVERKVKVDNKDISTYSACVLEYPTDIINELINRIERSSELLPESARKFGRMKCGYLFC